MNPPLTVIEKAVAIACACVIVAMLVIDHADRAAWLQFRDAHHCKVVEYFEGHHNTPNRQGWLCDDGVTYYRDAK